MTDVPLYTECVIGYRQWKLADWVLAPLVIGDPWRPGVNHASCQRGAGGILWSPGSMQETPKPPDGHASPHEHCDCGLYAYHEPPETSPYAVTPAYVLGAVAAWGDLRVHHDGFRAEYAQIVALVAQDHDLSEVAALYRVPVVSRDMLKMEAERHGQGLPVEVRPEKPPGYARVGMVTFGPNWYVSNLTFSSSPMTYVTTSSDYAVEEEDKPKKLGKRPSNRQGPQRPKRGPKNIGPRKNR